MKKSFLRYGAIACALVLPSFVAFAPPAVAGLTLTPTLVVIQGRERYADVSLINPDKEPAGYEVSWSFLKMEEGTGFYQNTDKSTTEFDLSKHIVMTPRRVTLKPNEMQRIRLGLRLNGEPPAPGDYRAHISFDSKRLTPGEAQPGMDKDGEKKTGKSRVGVNINVGFSIPVVYRVGESTDKVEIGTVTTQINKENKRIEVVVPVSKTKSNFGAMGAITIFYQGEVVGEVKNANIFAEISQRTFTIPLKKDKLAGGSLRIVYKSFDKKKDIILAEKTIPVGQ